MDFEFTEQLEHIVHKAEKYCSSDEHCRASVRAKLLIWGTPRNDIDRIVDYLCANDFINEERFSKAYCGSKMRVQQWGKIKMAYQLRSKQIPREIIERTIAEIDVETYNATLRDVTIKKWESLKSETNPRKRYVRLSNYLVSKGFDPDEIRESIDTYINNSEEQF